jgi:hypothetical protein
MDFPAVYYVNVSFAWILMLLSIAGYFVVSRKLGERWAFWPVFAAAWTMFGISHTLLLAGTSSDAWYIMLFRVLGYLFIVSALLVLMLGKKAK